jgi:hypothetical protein
MTGIPAGKCLMRAAADATEVDDTAKNRGKIKIDCRCPGLFYCNLLRLESSL